MRHYRFKRPIFSLACCSDLKKNNVIQCSNKGIYVNGFNTYCGVHLHRLDREIEVFDMMIREEGGYDSVITIHTTTLRFFQQFKKEQCSICLENITVNTGVLTHCNHSFHLNCFETWNVSLKKNNCPNCRRIIRTPSVQDNDMYSIMDVIHDPIVRQRLVESVYNNEDVYRLYSRSFSYDEAINLVGNEIF